MERRTVLVAGATGNQGGSVARALLNDLPTGIPHFDSKYEVEKHLISQKVPYTIVAPSYFMDNLFFPFNTESLNQGLLKMAMPGDRVLQQISGDELSGDKAAQILSAVLDKEIRYEGFSPDYMKEQSEDMALMFQWFIDHGYTADLAALKKYNFMSFEQWAMKQDWKSILSS